MSAGIALQELYARLSVRPDRASFAAGRDAVAKMGADARRAGAEASGAFAGVGATIKTAFGFDLYGWIKRGAAAVGELFVGGLKYNASLEESTNKVAGMLALAGNTRFADEVGNANDLMAELSARAAKLPGTTAEYVAMLGNVTQPAIAAGLKMSELTDLTVGATVAAKALGEDAGAAARDIGQALRGQAGADDPFIGKLLATKGFVGEKGRKKFNTSTAAERASIVKELLTSPQLTEMAAAQGATMGGVLSTLQDTVSRFFGASTRGLFDGLKDTLADINAWAERHADAISRVTGLVSRGLTAAFRGARAAVEFLGEVASAVAERVVQAVGQVFGSVGGAGRALEAAGAAISLAWSSLVEHLRVAWSVLGLVWRVASSVVAVVARLQAVFASVVARLLGLRSGADSVADGFAKSEPVLERVASFVDQIADAVTGVGEALIWVVDQVQSAADAVGPILDKLSWLSPVTAVGRILGRGGGGSPASVVPAGPNPWAGAVDAQLGAATAAPAGAGPSTTNNYAPTIHVNSTAPAADVAREVERAIAAKLRQAGAAVPR